MHYSGFVDRCIVVVVWCFCCNPVVEARLANHMVMSWPAWFGAFRAYSPFWYPSLLINLLSQKFYHLSNTKLCSYWETWSVEGFAIYRLHSCQRYTLLMATSIMCFTYSSNIFKSVEKNYRFMFYFPLFNQVFIRIFVLWSYLLTHAI